MEKKTKMSFSITEKIASQFRAKAYMKSMVMSRLVEKLIKDWIGDTFPQEEPKVVIKLNLKDEIIEENFDKIIRLEN